MKKTNSRWACISTRIVHQALALLAWLGIILAVFLIIEVFLISIGVKNTTSTEIWDRENKIILNNQIIKSTHGWYQPLIETPSIPIITKDRINLMIIGDSFVRGDGVYNVNHLWWRQLSNLLVDNGYCSTNIIPLGRNGASTLDQVQWLKNGKWLERFPVDHIILGYVQNDPDINRTIKRFTYTEPPIASRVLEFLTIPFPRLAELARGVIQRNIESRISYDNTTGYPYKLWTKKILEGENREQYKEIVASLKKAVGSTGITAFATPSSNDKEHFSEIFTSAKSIFSKTGIEFHDLTIPYTERTENIVPFSKLWANPVNPHPGPYLNSIFAKEIFSYLKTNGIVAKGGDCNNSAQYILNDLIPSNGKIVNLDSMEQEVTVPSNEELMPVMPVGKPHYFLSFSKPAEVESIEIASNNNTDLTIYLEKKDWLHDQISEDKLIELFDGHIDGEKQRFDLGDILELPASQEYEGLRVVDKNSNSGLSLTIKVNIVQ